MIGVVVIYKNKKRKYNVPNRITIEKLFKKIGINKEAVLVFRKGRPVPDTYELQNNDEIEAMLITTRG